MSCPGDLSSLYRYQHERPCSTSSRSLQAFCPSKLLFCYRHLQHELPRSKPSRSFQTSCPSEFLSCYRHLQHERPCSILSRSLQIVCPTELLSSAGTFLLWLTSR